MRKRESGREQRGRRKTDKERDSIERDTTFSKHP